MVTQHFNMFMFSKVVLCLCVSSLSALPQIRKRVRLPSTSYPAPSQDQEAAASKTFVTKAIAPVSLYSGPIAAADEEVSASSDSFLSSYGDQASAPASIEPVSLYSSPSQLARDFDYSETVNFLGDYDIQRDVDYAASLVSEAVSDYGTPQAEVLSNSVANDYSQPQADVISSSSTNFVTKTAPVITTTRIVNDYTQPKASVISLSESNNVDNYGSSDRLASGSSISNRVTVNSLGVKNVKSKPVAILRSENTGVNNGRYHYSYEAENGITQDVSGEMQTVNDAQVYVMRGSYSYIGPDGQTYTVDWYADETGYHPSAPHLPKSVEPNHPEVAEAVRQQRAFAAEEAAAAASTNNEVYAAPEENQFDNFDAFSAPAEDSLAGYGY